MRNTEISSIHLTSETFTTYFLHKMQLWQAVIEIKSIRICSNELWLPHAYCCIS